MKLDNEDRQLIFEMVVPVSKNINDNSAGHYKQYISAYEWLEKQSYTAVDILNGKPRMQSELGYLYPLKEGTDVSEVTLILAHYKNYNGRFDLLNYERVYKPIIDVITASGKFWEDDNYNIITGSIFAGGGSNVYKNGNFWLPPHEETLADKCLSMGAEFWMGNSKKDTKIGRFDLYQIYLVNINK